MLSQEQQQYEVAWMRDMRRVKVSYRIWAVVGVVVILATLILAFVPDEVFGQEMVYFLPDSIYEDGKAPDFLGSQNLKEVVQVLHDNPLVRAEIIGHASDEPYKKDNHHRDLFNVSAASLRVSNVYYKMLEMDSTLSDRIQVLPVSNVFAEKRGVEIRLVESQPSVDEMLVGVGDPEIWQTSIYLGWSGVMFDERTDNSGLSAELQARRGDNTFSLWGTWNPVWQLQHENYDVGVGADVGFVFAKNPKIQLGYSFGVVAGWELDQENKSWQDYVGLSGSLLAKFKLLGSECQARVALVRADTWDIYQKNRTLWGGMVTLGVKL